MSKKLSVLIAGVVVSLAAAAGTMQGCGSSSSSGNTALCMQACDKILMCTPDAGTAGMMAAQMCKANCSSTVSNTHCSNEAAIASAVQACLNMSCDQLATCEAGIPACQSTTGTGGSTGTGGTTGTGGSSGGGWTCSDNGQACACVAGASAGNPSSCTGTYNCCFSFSQQGTNGCSCTTAATTSDCSTIAQALSGTIINSCPP